MEELLFGFIFFLICIFILIGYDIYYANKNFYVYYQDYDGPDQILYCYKKNLRTDKVTKVPHTECMKNIGHNFEVSEKYIKWKHEQKNISY